MEKLTSRERYKRRCREAGRCITCGGHRRNGESGVRCLKCSDTLRLGQHLRRAMTLWCHGAPEEHVARLVIGPTRLRRWRGKTDTLWVRCRCGDERTVSWHGDRCRACGADLWPRDAEKSVRKRWIRATDAERAALLVG